MSRILYIELPSGEESHPFCIEWECCLYCVPNRGLMSVRASILLVALFLQQLPPPFHTPWYRKGTRTIPIPDGHQLNVPEGFSVNVFADYLDHARFMALAPNGDVFLAEPNGNKITVLRDTDQDGTAETRYTFASGL